MQPPLAAGSATTGLRWCLAALERPVRDLDRSIAFYARGLGFALASRAEATAVLCLGDERLVLRRVDAVQSPVDGEDVRFQHAAIVAGDMAAAFERLARVGHQAITRGGPQRLPARAGGVLAYKFRDPDGHPLELIAFAPGHGDPRWQGRAGTTLGIDHVALSVRDASASIAFHEQTFGFGVAARQVNHGPEQACLDGMDVSTVDVVSLAPGLPGMPHIELLAYRDPPPRRNDRSRGAVDLPWIEASIASGAQAPAAVRRTDPDGHAFRCALVPAKTACTP